jgi:hypothetical protein
MRILTESFFIVRTGCRTSDRAGNRVPAYIVAPPGYTRRESDGTLYRDAYAASPEIGPRADAHRFRSHRSASRVANQCAGATIEAVEVDRA